MGNSIFITTNPIVLYKDITATGSTGGGAEADVSTYNLAGNSLYADGMAVEFFCSAKHAANGNSTTFRPYVNGTAYGVLTSTGSGELCGAHLIAVRTSSTTLSIYGESHSSSGSFSQIHSIQTGVDFTAPIIIKYSVQAATTTNDLIGNAMRVTLLP